MNGQIHFMISLIYRFELFHGGMKWGKNIEKDVFMLK